MDVVIAATALVLISPLMVLIAVLIWGQGGTVLFVHRRIGFDGRPFNCYKFRTMCADPEGALSVYLQSNPEAEAEWLANRKLRRDPRVTLFGHILRKASLDELPQLFNVLRGEMSCVGPRPIVADELERYGEVARDYLRTRPGLTGLWQVNGRNTVDFARRVELDGQYVRTWCVRSDLAILFRTIFAVARFDETC
ncbi:sugar transferase [Aurantimonas sp. A2-1-M11]